MNKTFAQVTTSDFQKNYINIIPKTVDQLSVVYRDSAVRELQKDGVKDEKLTEYYNSLLYNVNSADKMASRYAKLANTSITRICFENGKIKYKVLPTWYYDIVCADDDPYKMVMLSYKTYFNDTLYRVVWTDTEHYRIEAMKFKGIETSGDKEPVDDTNKDMKNPYGVIPYAVLRLKEQGDFFGNGMNDLVNGNEQINIILCELMNEHILMGGVGMILAVNCKLNEKKADGTYTKNSINVSRKDPIVLDNVTTDNNKVPPSLDYVTTDPQMLELRDTVDWYIKELAIAKGLNPNSFLAEVQDTSGLSKIMDAFEQMELRKDDIEPSRIFEDERFEKTVRVNDYHQSTTDGSKYKLQKIGEGVYLKVDFAEVKTYYTPEQQQKIDDWDIKHNLINILDIARRNNPDLNTEELGKSLDENKVINDKYKVQPIETKKPEEETVN